MLTNIIILSFDGYPKTRLVLEAKRHPRWYIIYLTINYNIIKIDKLKITIFV